MSWNTIESDPGVFTELIEKFGTTGIQVEELWSAEDIDPSIKPVHGLIFLFKWQKGAPKRECLQAHEAPHVFFANQVINNACATQAILSILLNLDSGIKGVDIGRRLKEFKEFTHQLPPQIKGEAIQMSEEIRTAHNSFAKPEPFVMESSPPSDDDEAFHFISYVPINGEVFELDGLQEGPIRLGKIGEDGDWMKVAVPEIRRRIEEYSKTEIRFNLLALVGNIKQKMEHQLGIAQRRLDLVKAKLNDGEGKDVEPDPDFELGGSKEELGAQKVALEQECNAFEAKIDDEVAKFKRWKKENERRKHNFVPFILELLTVLAEKNQLSGLLEKAQKRVQEARERRQKEKASGKGGGESEE